MTRGLTREQMAAEIGCSVETIKDDVAALYQELGVSTPAEVVARIYQERFAARRRRHGHNPGTDTLGLLLG